MAASEHLQPRLFDPGPAQPVPGPAMRPQAWLEQHRDELVFHGTLGKPFPRKDAPGRLGSGIHVGLESPGSAKNFSMAHEWEQSDIYVARVKPGTPVVNADVRAASVRNVNYGEKGHPLQHQIGVTGDAWANDYSSSPGARTDRGEGDAGDLVRSGHMVTYTNESEAPGSKAARVRPEQLSTWAEENPGHPLAKQFDLTVRTNIVGTQGEMFETDTLYPHRPERTRSEGSGRSTNYQYSSQNHIYRLTPEFRARG